MSNDRNIDFSEIKGDDCDLEAPPERGNATEGTPGSNGAGVDRDGIGNGTSRLLASNALLSPPSLS
jgi:hypothetical protein